MPMVEADENSNPPVPTFATDGYEIRYNRGYIEKEKMTVGQIIGVLTHEVMHVVLLHHTRCGTRNAIKWNMAGDFAINKILVDNKMELPGKPRTLAESMGGAEGYLLDSQFDGWTTEQIYEKIPDPPKCYGCGGMGQVTTPKGNDSQGNPKTIAGAEAEAQVMINSAKQAAKQCGKMPLGIERFIEDSLDTKIDWREKLQRFFRRTKLADESWKRQNRRFIHQGVYLPTQLREPTGDVVIVVDTSGSIGGPELEAFVSEMKSIYDFVKPEKVYVMYCDAAIGRVDIFEPAQGDELTIKPVGGGGTDFRPPFSWLRQKGIEPEAFVYLTDGYGPFPDRPAEFPVLWVINNNQVKPPWGEHIILDMN